MNIHRTAKHLPVLATSLQAVGPIRRHPAASLGGPVLVAQALALSRGVAVSHGHSLPVLECPARREYLWNQAPVSAVTKQRAAEPMTSQKVGAVTQGWSARSCTLHFFPLVQLHLGHDTPVSSDAAVIVHLVAKLIVQALLVQLQVPEGCQPDRQGRKGHCLHNTHAQYTISSYFFIWNGLRVCLTPQAWEQQRDRASPCPASSCKRPARPADRLQLWKASQCQCRSASPKALLVERCTSPAAGNKACYHLLICAPEPARTCNNSRQCHSQERRSPGRIPAYPARPSMCWEG